MRWLDRHEVGFVFLAHLWLYLTLSIYLTNVGFYTPDSLVTSGKAMLSMVGAEPKLAHVGFVAPPLFAVLSIMAALATFFQGFLFVPKLVSSLLASWLVALLHGGMRQEGLALWQRLILLVSFSLNPLFVYCATSGEEASTFLLLYALFLSSLLSAVERKRLYHLFYAGLGLGLAFFTAYETVLAAILSFPYLFLSLREEGDVSPERARTVYASLYLPVLYAVMLWMGMNWVIMGDPLYFVRGPYSQAMASPSRPDGGLAAALGLAVQGALAVSPLYFLLALFIRGRALLLLLLPVVVYALGFFWGSGSIPFSKYIIVHLTAFPLALYARRPAIESLEGRNVVLGLLLISLLVSIPSTFYWMDKFRVGNLYEREFREIVYFGGGATNYAEEKEISAYLQEEIRAGSLILLDDLRGYPIIAFSQRPSAFITPGHSRFFKALENPWAHGVNYLLVPDPQRPPGGQDAINTAYPRLFLEGHSGLILEKAFRSWKLFKVEGRA